MTATVMMLLLGACSAGKADKGRADEAVSAVREVERPAFDADSAYGFVAELMEFGPRVPNTEAHRKAGDWLEGKLEEFGWETTSQKAVLTAFDGTQLNMRNIFARLNPGKGNRLLLLAHWDCRPWADADPDPAKRKEPVAGANDGASGVGVLLEIARQLSLQKSDASVDILLVDAEDWGDHDNDESWAMGTRYFAEHPPVEGYRPLQAILLDMVGSPDAKFGYEYFSSESNPQLLQELWRAAASLGHGDYFHTGFGGAVTDDHVELIKAGIPAIDIIDYRNTPAYQGFDPVWHTTSDTMDNISPRTLGAVGESILYVIHNS